jgi:glycosyltransferase involved in cell wall biosynthesis
MTRRPNSVLFLGLETYSLIGGIQQFNQRVIRNLAAMARRAIVSHFSARLLRDRDQDVPTELQAYVRAGGTRRLRYVLDLVSELRSANTLLLGHMNLLPVAVLARWLNPSVRTVLFVHGDDAWGGPLRPPRAGDRFALRYVDVVASVSTYTARVMAKAYDLPSSKFTIFPNVVDPLPPGSVSPKHKQPRSILAVTRLGAGDRLKNVDVLIRAMAHLRAEGIGADLTVVGDGALRPELEQLAVTLGISGAVKFIGRVSDERLREEYGRSSAFALPSSKEGFGIVYLEAWQHGLPVVCGTLGAPAEIIEDGVDGFVADEGDPRDVADKLKRLIQDPTTAAAMGAMGKKKVVERYEAAVAERNLAVLIRPTAPGDGTGIAADAA